MQLAQTGRYGCRAPIGKQFDAVIAPTCNHKRNRIIIALAQTQVAHHDRLPFTVKRVKSCRETLEPRHRFVLVQSRPGTRSEEHTSELQSRGHLVCRLLLEKKKQ